VVTLLPARAQAVAQHLAWQVAQARDCRAAVCRAAELPVAQVCLVALAADYPDCLVAATPAALHLVFREVACQAEIASAAEAKAVKVALAALAARAEQAAANTRAITPQLTAADERGKGKTSFQPPHDTTPVLRVSG
jgi:hypothetical protein